jgi:hypothetical protein
MPGKPKVAVDEAIAIANQVEAKLIQNLEEYKSAAGVCRYCGCTETTPCLERVGRQVVQPCAWTDRTQTLCTACQRRNDVEIEATVKIAPILERLCGARAPSVLGDRARLAEALKAAYIAGRSYENDLIQYDPRHDIPMNAAYAMQAKRFEEWKGRRR